MKKYFRALFIVLAAFIALSACASGPRVSMADPNTRTDRSGRWSDADSRQVSATLIEKCLGSPALDDYIEQYRVRHDGERPSIVLQRFTYEASEHINTDIIASIMEEAIVNSGRLKFVAGGELRENIRTERQDQQSHASEDTAAALGNETGAALVLTGNISLQVDRAGGTQDRSYFVSAELIDVETGDKVWIGRDDSIKKTIQQSKAKF
ncbi:MAG: penicillin-binding protein activator LpoB [Treponema sp.]|jgi:PBP1b-binding outer membrane lipoprotein LpoB|nr:penicillin-binding protein activator LpoB [Treponema sp.]